MIRTIPTLRWRPIISLCVFLAGSGWSGLLAGEGALRLHPLFSDNMVLQREGRSPVWGWAEPGSQVEVRIDGQLRRTTTAADGEWMVRLKKMRAGGPYELEVSGGGALTLTNVLVGDVWICSGQSNMEMGIGEVNNAAEEIARARYERIRLFAVPKHIAMEPQSMVDSRWRHCTPENIAQGDYNGFTAAGFFFGRDLHMELGVPIGLIDSSWGGTVAEAWTSEEALSEMEDFRPALDQFRGMAEAMKAGAMSWETLQAEWYEKVDIGSSDPGWSDPGLGDDDWASMGIPQNWEQGGLEGFDGVVWFRKTIELPAIWAGRSARLELGAIDDRDTTWVNGVPVGAMDVYNQARSYDVAEGILKAGENVVAVRVLDTGGGGGFAGKAEQMRMVVASGDPLPAIELAGAWQYRRSVALNEVAPVPQRMASNPNVVTVLYNGMIAPLVPFGIRGAIWYQGESNASRAEQYQRLLPTMIRDWRSRFGVGEFPFLIVQLANFMAVNAEPVESDWAELREAQWLTTQTEPRTGLAVAIDIGEADDIHPRDKQEVGRRLALAARAIAYGQKLPYSGPSYRSIRRKGDRLGVRFDHADGGLVAQGGGKLQGFAVAGADGRFVWAKAEIDGSTVWVSSPDIPDPVKVRYGWANNPACNLYNRAGLPAVPFRTDGP